MQVFAGPVCMVTDDFLPAATGVGVHVQTIAKGLAVDGTRVSVVTTRRHGEPAFEIWNQVHVHRVRAVSVAGFYQAIPTRRELRRILDAERPGIVHLHYLSVMMLQMLAVAKERSLPIIYTHHMTVDVLVQPWFMRPFRRPLASLIVRSINKVDQVVTVSDSLASTVRSDGIRAPIVTISNPVDLPEAPLGPPPARSEEFVVMYAGRLEPEKNLPLLLRAFAAFHKHAPRSILWVAGKGSEQVALEHLSRRLGIADCVRFLGFLGRSELRDRYRTCDVFVLPSFVETQGLVAMEAMSQGKAVLLATSVMAAQELLERDFRACTFQPDDPAELASLLRGLHDDPGLGRSLGSSAAERAGKWRLDAILTALRGAYLDVLDAVGTPGRA